MSKIQTILLLGRSAVARKVLFRKVVEQHWTILRRMASAYRWTLIRRTHIVAVTGSFGKTTTMSAIAAVLGQSTAKRRD